MIFTAGQWKIFYLSGWIEKTGKMEYDKETSKKRISISGGEENGIRFRTYLDLCQRWGKKAEESATREAEGRLREHGFDPESGKARSEETLPPEIRKEAKPEENTEAVARAIEKLNHHRLKSASVRLKVS